VPRSRSPYPPEFKAEAVRFYRCGGRSIVKADLGGSKRDCLDSMGLGVGRLLVDDVASRAAAAGARCLDVAANPNAVGFYERLGFAVTGQASTLFGTAPRMRRDLGR
jgi:hypothetical protein